MTVQQYLDSPFDPGGYTYWKGRHVQPFTGPKLRHLKLDLDIGAIELYQHVEVASQSHCLVWGFFCQAEFVTIIPVRSREVVPRFPTPTGRGHRLRAD
jgi:hypothetical protein